jgi:hypothetical protein
MKPDISYASGNTTARDQQQTDFQKGKTDPGDKKQSRRQGNTAAHEKAQSTKAGSAPETTPRWWGLPVYPCSLFFLSRTLRMVPARTA